MKLTILLLTIAFFQVHASGNAQSITLNAKKMSLRSVFEAIEKQTGFSVFYNDEQISNANPVTITAQQMPLKEFLTTILEKEKLAFVISKGNILIKAAPRINPSDKLNIASGIAPPVLITGTITDANKQPLAGAIVQVKGRQVRVVSDERGVFQINVEENTTLVVYYIGYREKEIKATGSASMAIIMEPVEQMLEATQVVSTGYQTLSRDRSAGAFAKVDMNVVANRSFTPNIIARLEGQVPGLTMQGPAGVLVRGQSSINAATIPLVVIDGIEFNGTSAPMSEGSTILDQLNINVQDVEDITVLKDATAASIWGARAANGVIVITTKKGRTGEKLKFDYDAYYAFQGRPDLDYVPRMNTQQFIALSKELFPQYYALKPNFPSVAQTFGTLPHLKILYDQQRNLITQAQADFKLDSLAALSNKDQIADLFVRDAATINQTISVSGGGRSHNFYGSLNHIGTRDNVPGNSNNQYKINLSNTFSVGKKFTASINADLTNTITRNGNTYNPSRNIVPYQMFTDANGIPLNIDYLGRSMSETPLSDSMRAIYQTQSGLDLTFNPVLEQNRAYSTSNSLFARLVGTFKVNLVKGLDFQGTYGYNMGNTNIRQVRLQDNYDMRMQVLAYTEADNTTADPIYNIPNIGGRLVAGTNSSKDWTIRNQFSYNLDWRKHQLTLMAGQQATSYAPVATNATYYGWDDQLQTSRPVDLAKLAQGITGLTGQATLGNNVEGGEGRIVRTTAYFATLGYTYNRKYTINGSWRIDESNSFGRDISAQNRPIYSIGGMWALNRENFMQDVYWLNRLNVRLTYGITGNAPPVGYGSSFDILSASNNVNYVTGAGYLLQSPGNALLTWEGTTVYNAGFDFSILAYRLSGSVEGYIKKTRDLIGDLATSPFTGYASVPGNYGNIDNKGIEVSLNSVNIRSGNFSWNSGLTFSYNKNKLTLLRENAPVTGEALVNTSRLVGYPLNALFAYNYGGLNAEGNPQIVRADKSKTAELNVATTEDILYMGTTQPAWSGGIQNSFQYKSLSLSVNIIYNGGYVVRSNRNPTMSDQVVAYNDLQLGFLDRWKKPGDENVTEIPRAGLAGTYNLSYYTSSQRFIMNGAYAKIRDITLQYNLPQTLANKIAAQAISFRFQLNNLLLWTANSIHMDPEFTGSTRSAQGTVSFGTHITF